MVSVRVSVSVSAAQAGTTHGLEKKSIGESTEQEQEREYASELFVTC